MSASNNPCARTRRAHNKHMTTTQTTTTAAYLIAVSAASGAPAVLDARDEDYDTVRAALEAEGDLLETSDVAPDGPVVVGTDRSGRPWAVCLV